MYIKIDKKLDMTITKQLYEGLMNKILQNELKAQEHLPSSRSLARELGISRIIVVEVYEQLIAEGYIYTKKGSGTFISDGVCYGKAPTNTLESHEEDMDKELLYDIPNDYISFRAGVPDLSSVPLSKWGKLYNETIRDASEGQLDYQQAFGSITLRKTLVKYLLRVRGVKTRAKNILITNGAAQAFSLLRELISADDYVLIENPSSVGIREPIELAGIKYESIEVDSLGLRTDLLPIIPPKLIYTTPSHQFPTGVVLHAQRRIELMKYAKKHHIYIVEDDYDSEFRYGGQPIQSMQSIDPNHTIYVGTFSKCFSPAIRLGYMVIPEELIERVEKAKYCLDIHSPIFEQLTMSKFIERGYLDRYIRKMNKVYASRRSLIASELKRRFDDVVDIKGDRAGLHMMVEFKLIKYNHKLVDYLDEYKISIEDINKYKLGKLEKNLHLILGYGNTKEEEILDGLNRLENLIKRLQTS